MKPKEAAAAMQVFRKKRVGHRTAGDARNDLFEKLVAFEGDRIIALVGPSTVGKTTVVARVQEQLIEHHKHEIENDSGFIPFLSISAVTGFDGNFSWKDGFARLLCAANEPLITKKLRDKRLIVELDGMEITNSRGLVKDELRRAFESMIKHRGIRYVFLDEGSAIVDAGVNRDLLRQFNILKSLCVSLGIAIVMIGAYDLLGYTDGNGQLVRRTEVIHMRRYFLEEPTLFKGQIIAARDFSINGQLLLGKDHFNDAMDSLLQLLPIKYVESIFNDRAYYFMKSVGCVGNLHRWLDRGCTHALIHNDGILTKNIMEITALKNFTVKKLLTEAILGEKQLEDTADAEIANLYGVESLKTECSNEPGQKDSPEKNQKSGRVGQRGPSRDVVGGLYV